MKVFNIILPIVLILLGLFTSLNIFFTIVVLYLIYLFFTNRQILNRLKSKYFLSFIAVLVIIYPLFGENKDLVLPLSIGYDFNYLEMSVRMSLRAILLFGFSNMLLISISTSMILSKLKFANSDKIIEIAMNNYENIARKTKEHFKTIDYKNIKISKITDYIAIFMADLLSVNLLNYDVSSTKKENL